MEQLVARLLTYGLGEAPLQVTRCTQGIGNFVFDVRCSSGRYILRCSREPSAYVETVGWLEKLAALDIPVPKVVWHGSFEAWSCLVLTWLEGRDIGLEYSRLSYAEKCAIAREVEAIQRKVAALKVEVPPGWRWRNEVDALLDRAEGRIRQNGHFTTEKVFRLRKAARELEAYFSAVKPTAYLDDISSKNLLVHRGKLSGIVDVDWMGVGDRLTYVALTRMALLDLEYDTDYADCLLAEIAPDEAQMRAYQFYTLLYCVDFMGERGMQFLDKQVPASPEIIQKLNNIFDRLWNAWVKM